MSLQVDIQAALCAQLKTPALSGSPQIVWPLVDADPPASGPYLDVRPVLRAAPEHFGMSYGNKDIHTGIFQVDAVSLDSAGEAIGLALADLVAAHFAIGTKLTAGSLRLEIVGTPTIAPVVKDAPWVRFPVSIPYRVIT